MNFTNSLEVAVGIILAVLVLVALHWLITLPGRIAARQRRERLEEGLHEMAHDIIKGFEEAKAAEANKPKRRRPTTKKAPAKPVAKKGATNAKASTRK